MWPSSVDSERRNLRRAGVLKKRSRTSTSVPAGRAISLTSRSFPPAISMRVPESSDATRVSSTSRETAAIEGRASPRNPSVEISNRSSAERILLVAWRSKASNASSRRSEEHTSELQSLAYLVCRLLLEKKKKTNKTRVEHTHKVEVDTEL